jgi:hypothetical protein
MQNDRCHRVTIQLQLINIIIITIIISFSTSGGTYKKYKSSNHPELNIVTDD